MIAILKITLIVALATWAIRKVLSGAPYMPTGDHHIKNMLARSADLPGAKMADIGAGDGRIVIAFAKAGFEAHGFEHNPFLVWWARRNIRLAGLEKRAFIHRQNLWKTNFSPFQIVTVFGITHIMPKLEKKLRHELSPGSRVFSIVFEFPTWKAEPHDGFLREYRV